MKLLTKRSPRPDKNKSRELVDPSDEETPASDIADADHVAKARLASKAISWGFAACLVAAPISLVVGVADMFSTPAQSSPTAGPATTVSTEEAIAGEYAGEVVVAWLTATRDDSTRLEALLPPSLVPRVGEIGYSTSAPTVAAIEKAGDTWSVTIGVTVSDATGASARRYFQVPVAVVDQAVSVLALPTPVAGPAPGEAGKLEYPVSVSSTSPLMSAIADFLGAYLTGVGDVSRYVTPGSTITPVLPAPYSSVEISSVSANDRDVDLTSDPGDGATLRVLVTAAGLVSREQKVDVEFALTMTARDGRWEVESIDPAPAWSPIDSGSEEPATPTAPPVPSTTATTPEEQ